MVNVNVNIAIVVIVVVKVVDFCRQSSDAEDTPPKFFFSGSDSIDQMSELLTFRANEQVLPDN